MTTPRYITRKIDGQYRTVRADPGEANLCAGCVAAGAAVGLFGLLRGGFSGKLLAATGAGLLYRGLTGKNPLEKLKAVARHRAGGQTPSYPHGHAKTSQQAPEDAVDEAAMESFPASDAPARSGAAH